MPIDTAGLASVRRLLADDRTAPPEWQGNGPGPIGTRGGKAASARGLVALAAWIVAGLAGVALAEALLDPAETSLVMLGAALIATLGAVAVLLLRLRRSRAAAADLAARLEAVEDANWELEEAKAGVPTGDAASGFEPALSIATVSHELRAPLHGMQGLTDLLAETALSPEQRAYVEALGQSTAALGRVVDDLLDASRIATGHFSLDPAPTAIEPLVEQVAELMGPRAFAKGLSIATHIACDLPPVEADAGRLRQVLINLLANAISFSDQGGVILTVERVRRDDDRLRLRFGVSDTGRGVAPADRARIFGSFERAADGGAGLGLAISSRIVERMGSRLALAPRPGGGSIFSFEISLGASGGAGDPAPRLAGRRVLLALRAETEARMIAATIADEAGEATLAATEIAAAGLLGAAMAAGQSFDAVLVDFHLLADPAHAPARLREAAGRDLPLVVLIEPGEREQIKSLRDAGFDGYLLRPVRRASLTRIVDELTLRGGDFVVDPTDRAGEAPEARPRGPLRALVVEDDPVSALLVRAVIEKLGHDVSEAASLAAAREILARRTVDLVLVDLRLGSEDGAALLRELGARRDGQPFPALIAMSADKAALDPASAGADIAIAKPVSPDSLRHAIAAACRFTAA